jgi:AmmeMemoRadiSam system protein B
VAQALRPLVLPDTLLLVSSDLSHYHGYDEAVTLDRQTIEHMLKLEIEPLGHEAACGCAPVCALLHLAKAFGWQAQLLQYQNSGDTAGDRNRVVGYAAVAYYEA